MIDALTRLRGRDEVRFFLHWLRRPDRIGAVVPSGPALAAALAAEIDIAAPGAVVELGPGMGQVTRALLDAGVTPDDLVAVERNGAFCRLLRERFPEIRILRGEAERLDRLLNEARIDRIKAVVSSLPLLSMTGAERRRILSQIAAVLEGDGVLVQYTYGLAAPVPEDLAAELGLVGERTSWVVANLPPAAVWRYRRRAPLPEFARVA